MQVENSNQNMPFIELPTTTTEQIKNLQVCFCIDVSGSTSSGFADNYNYLQVEQRFVNWLAPGFSKSPTYIAWDSESETVQSINTLVSKGGTEPACLFENSNTNETIRKADVMILITDGQIYSNAINRFSKCMINHGAHLKAIIGVIVGRRSKNTSDRKLRTSVAADGLKDPSEINISVLVPAMISNGCILFHNFNNTYIMWSCGILKQTWNPVDIDEETEWSNVSTVNDANTIYDINIPVPNEQDRIDLHNRGYISFGMGLFFNPDFLIRSEPTWDQLIDYPFDRICQYFRVSQRYPDLLEWLKSQKNRFLEEFMSDNSEKENVDQLIDSMLLGQADSNNSNVVSSSRSNYIAIRNRTIARRYIDDEEINNLFNDQRIVTLVQFFRRMMEIMEEDNREVHNPSSYVCSSISTSRYTIAANNSCVSNTRAHKSTLSITITCNFTEPLKWQKQFERLYPEHKSTKWECSICCEEDIPFIMIRKFIDKNNISNIVDKPLEYFYPQIVCSKCATYFCNKGCDPVRAPCHAAIPIVNLVGDSKYYFLENFHKITLPREEQVILESSIPSTTNYNYSFDKKEERGKFSGISNKIFSWFSGKNMSEPKNAELDKLLFSITVFIGLIKEYFSETTPDFSRILGQIAEQLVK